jgi:hypothetical protein
MANLMDLVRELKALNARKKAGETLSPTEEARRKELKGYLRSTLEAQGGAASLEDSAVREVPQRGGVPAGSSAHKEAPTARVPSASSAPKAPPVPSAAQQAAQQAAVAPTRASPRPVSTPTAEPAGRDSFMEDMLPPVKSPAAPPTPQPAAPKPYVPKKDVYAIQDANALIDAAAASDAVAKVDPLALRKAHASSAEVEEAEQRAEAAVRANKKKPRAQTPEEAAEQLAQSSGGYTPPDDNYALEQYYGEFATEGYQFVDARDAGDLKPIDPREIELAKLDAASGPGTGSTNVAVPAGLAFIDDFPALYAKRVLPPPDDEVTIDSNDPNMLIPGKRKVTVHLLNGEKKQGSIRSLRRGELGFRLEPVGNGHVEELSISQVKAVFIHLQANQAVKDVPGRPLTATFRDGRAVQGVSDDYQPGAPVFTLVPPAGRGQFERIIVNAAAVSSVQ